MRYMLAAVLCLSGLTGCTSYYEIVYSPTTIPVDECTFVGEEVELTMEGMPEEDAMIVGVRPDTLYAKFDGQDTVSSLPLAQVNNIRMPGVPWPFTVLEVAGVVLLDIPFAYEAVHKLRNPVPLIALGLSAYLLVDALIEEGFTFRRIDDFAEPVFAPGEPLTIIIVSKPKAHSIESVTIPYRDKIITLRRSEVRVERRVDGWRITVPTRLLPAE